MSKRGLVGKHAVILHLLQGIQQSLWGLCTHHKAQKLLWLPMGILLRTPLEGSPALRSEGRTQEWLPEKDTGFFLPQKHPGLSLLGVHQYFIQSQPGLG